MINISEYIQHSWLSGIHEASRKPSKGLVDYLLTGPVAIVSQIEQKKLEFTISDYKAVTDSITFDINRFSSASFESISSVSRLTNIPKSAAWIVISTYYAAYFAGHALLRIFGTSCSNIDTTTARHFTSIADTYGQRNGVTIAAGYYAARIDRSSSTIKIESMGDKGVHEAFWQEFLAAIKKTSEHVLGLDDPSGNNQIVYLKLSNLIRIITKNGKNGGNWLSFVRNNVNYRHEMGTWFPYTNQSTTFSNAILTKHGNWIVDPMSIELDLGNKDDLLQFYNACIFIVNLCRISLHRISELSPHKMPLVESGSLKLVRLITG